MTRRRTAQACMLAAGAAVLLPWQVLDAGDGSVKGTSVDGGQIVLVVGLVTIGLIQVGWRPAWIGAGLVGAITTREIASLAGDGGSDPAYGLWIAVVASAAAVVLLVWDMFASVAAGGGADRDDGKPGGRGLSGPLGRRH